MALIEKAVGEVAFAASLALVAIGVYGLTSTNNMLRMLLSLEVIFNGILLGIVAYLSFQPIMASIVAILLVAVVAAEVIVTMAILAGLYRQVRTFETTGLEEEGV